MFSNDYVTFLGQWIDRYGNAGVVSSTYCVPIGSIARARPRRVAVDETAVTIGTEQQWLYAAIESETKLVLGVRISGRRGTDPVAEKHDLSEATFLVNGMGYLTALMRYDLRGHLDYVG